MALLIGGGWVLLRGLESSEPVAVVLSLLAARCPIESTSIDPNHGRCRRSRS